MRRSPKSLNAQLDAYSAAVKPLTATSAGRLANWSVYAMATGSALAMATSANASIIYSGPLSLTASLPPVDALTYGGVHTARISLNTGPFAGGNATVFRVLNGSFTHGNRFFGSALLFGSSHVINASNNAKRLAFGSAISAVPIRPSGGILWAKTNSYSGGTWPDGVVGYAGIRLHGSGDYGWLKLSWTGEDNFPDTINLYGWAVQTDGSAILAGDIGPTPEPGTFGLALLAAGAAGVLAWRRRKQLAAE